MSSSKTTTTTTPHPSSSAASSTVNEDHPHYYNVDGSQGEGGGQVLRNAISYACIFQRPLVIHKIRAKRSKPGLQAQHVAAISLAAAIGGGTLDGAVLKSSQIAYQPAVVGGDDATAMGGGGDKEEEEEEEEEHENTKSTNKKFKSNNNNPTMEHETVYTGTINTAGSICLLLQAALPCALLCRPPTNTATAAMKLVLKGGTNASMAPQFDYWQLVFVPTLLRHLFGVVDDDNNNNNNNNIIQATVLTRGYYPKGGGQVEVTLPNLVVDNCPLKLPMQAFDLTERGMVQHIYIRSFHAGKLPRHMATRMAHAAQQTLEEYFQQCNTPTPTMQVDIATEPNAVGSGLGILLVATTSTGLKLGGSSLCKPKQKAIEAGRQAADELVACLQSGGCVDDWLQDQLILYMALAQGTSCMLTGNLTLHTQTAIHVAQQLVPNVQFHVERLQGDDDNNNHNSDACNTVGEPDPNDAASILKVDYGQEGLIPGKHLITCHGVSYKTG